MLEHPARHFRLVGGEREDHRRRREFAEGERLRQRDPHQRRRIVEQHDQRALGGGAVIRREIGVEIGAGQGGSGIATLRGRSGAYPLEKMTNDHVATDATSARFATTPGNPAPDDSNPMARALIKRSP
jgi:hypothetical protein